MDWIFPTDVPLEWKTVDYFIKRLPGMSTRFHSASYITVIITSISVARNYLVISGVVETGIFIDLAKTAYFGHDDGNVTFIGAANA